MAENTKKVSSSSSEQVVRAIRRQTRRKFSAAVVSQQTQFGPRMYPVNPRKRPRHTSTYRELSSFTVCR